MSLSVFTDYSYRGPDESQVHRAKLLTEDLLEVVRAERVKAKEPLQQQQMELHQAQATQHMWVTLYVPRVFHDSDLLT